MLQIKLYGTIAYHVIKVVISLSCKCWLPVVLYNMELIPDKFL